jgi:hypothetical protein
MNDYPGASLPSRRLHNPLSPSPLVRSSDDSLGLKARVALVLVINPVYNLLQVGKLRDLVDGIIHGAEKVVHRW